MIVLATHAKRMATAWSIWILKGNRSATNNVFSESNVWPFRPLGRMSGFLLHQMDIFKRQAVTPADGSNTVIMSVGVKCATKISLSASLILLERYRIFAAES